MPTVTAVALGTLLEPRSSSSASHEIQRSLGTATIAANGNNNDKKPSHAAIENQRHRIIASSTSASSPKLNQINQHHHLGEVGDEEQPLSPQHRLSYPGATTSLHNARPNGVQDGNGRAPASGPRARPSATGYYISPKLYTTPDSARIVPTGSNSASSPTSDCSSPSPYVVNHKRRGLPRSPLPPRGASSSGIDGDGSAEMKPPPRDHMPEMLADQRGSNGTSADENGSNTQHGDCGDALDKNKHPDDEGDDFFNPQEQLMSSVRGSDTDDAGCSFRRIRAGRHHHTTPTTNHAEFYDASEEFVSDGSVSHASPSFCANIEAELSSIQHDIFEEIDRRKKAEQSLVLMQNIFQRIARQLSQVGLPTPHMGCGWELQFDVDSIAQFCQELVVTRFVFEALEVGLVHAEAQAAADVVIEAKNHEITRLRGRLQYYEAMNCEMSQRNQAAIELARRRRLRNKIWQRWVWGCVGLSITVGASILAYAYFPHGDGNPSLSSSGCDDSQRGG